MAYKILTVDDSKTIRMIVKKAFTPYNCELFEAENGVEGLALAAKEKPDLIILDITMPVMSGVEMLERLKTEKEMKSIPVIMLTAESGKDNVMKIVKLGVKDYMVKPFKGDQLLDRARKVLNLREKD
ncbi:MAG: response regulator [Desulfobacteraceae bacterium]|nr:response regulator [Desulfobacteraceae bacterium]